MRGRSSIDSSSMSSTDHDSPLVVPVGLSEKSRTLSANTLGDRLSKLAAPLNVVYPVAALRANIKYVFSLGGIIHCAKQKICYLYFCSSFVPAHIPRKRRLQMLAVAVWSCMIAITTCAFLLLWYVCLFTHFNETLFSTLLRIMTCGYLDGATDLIYLVPFHHCGRS